MEELINKDKAEIQSFVPVSYCVNQALIDMEDFSGLQKERYTNFAIRAFETLRMFSINSVKVAYLSMNELLCAKLPDDYIDYVKVGINMRGVIWTLGMNSDIALPRDADCGNDARDLYTGNLVYPTGGYYFTDHYRDGEFVGGLYGMGGGFREAYYRIDRERHQIVFSGPTPRGEVVLEYKSSGISSQTLIPREAVNAIVAYIHYKRNINKDRVSMLTFKELFDEEEQKLRSLNFKFTYEEYMDMLYSNSRQTLKR